MLKRNESQTVSRSAGYSNYYACRHEGRLPVGFGAPVYRQQPSESEMYPRAKIERAGDIFRTAAEIYKRN